MDPPNNNLGLNTENQVPPQQREQQQTVNFESEMREPTRDHRLQFDTNKPMQHGKNNRSKPKYQPKNQSIKRGNPTQYNWGRGNGYGNTTTAANNNQLIPVDDLDFSQTTDDMEILENGFHQMTVHKTLYDTQTAAHNIDCQNTMKRLILRCNIKKTEIDLLVRQNAFNPDDITGDGFTTLFNYFVQELGLENKYMVPKFLKIRKGESRWSFNIKCVDLNQALDFLAKRKNLRGKGGLDWTFPGTKELRQGLDAMKKKKLIKNWVVNVKTASISLVIDEVEEEPVFYTIRNPLDVSGMLRSCKNKQDICKIIKSKRFIFTEKGLLAYKDDDIQQIGNRYRNLENFDRNAGN